MFKVNEYIRTSEGNIYKYNENNEKVFIDNFEEMLNVVKHSKNIIDLIEKDDWINGQRVKEVKNGYVMVGNGIDGFMIWGRDIQRIVTKEQFENIEYKVNT